MYQEVMESAGDVVGFIFIYLPFLVGVIFGITVGG